MMHHIAVFLVAFVPSFVIIARLGTRSKKDNRISAVLSFFFAIGVMLLVW